MRFANKTVIVTGGTSGIGFATAKQIISEGGSVIVTGRNSEKLERAVKELGPNAKGFVVDSASVSGLRSFADKIRESKRQVQGLFINAGAPLLRNLKSTTEDEFDQLMNVNLKGVFFSLQILASVLEDGSSIVLTGSVAGEKASPQMIAYAASKAAVRSLARSASVELLPRKIRVNVLSPGPIETPIWEVEGNALPKQALSQLEQSHPMKRFGRVEEVASVASMLLSDESTYMAGANILVDGGLGQF